jgi:hypothetical protein
MTGGQMGMFLEHPGAGITHHFLDFFSELRFVTVNMALATGGSLCPKRTATDPFDSVSQQPGTLGTGNLTAIMMIPAIELDHHPNGLTLSGQFMSGGRKILLRLPRHLFQ